MSRYTTTDFERGMDVGRQVVAVQLKDENDKLQSLVKQFYWYTKSMREALRQCKDKNPYYLEVLDDSLAKVYDQMDELGIEVD